MTLKMKRKISIIGMGYVGCGNALVLAQHSQVSIVDVDMNPALSSAKVLFSVMSTGSDIDSLASLIGVKAALNEHSGYIRGAVGRKLNLKYAPRLIFVQSESLAKAVDLVDLIDRTVEKDDENREHRIS